MYIFYVSRLIYVLHLIAFILFVFWITYVCFFSVFTLCLLVLHNSAMRNYFKSYFYLYLIKINVNTLLICYPRTDKHNWICRSREIRSVEYSNYHSKKEIWIHVESECQNQQFTYRKLMHSVILTDCNLTRNSLLHIIQEGKALFC